MEKTTKWNIKSFKNTNGSKKIIREAFMESDDTLCTLTVEVRKKNTKLTEIDCNEIILDPFQDISIKFDKKRNVSKNWKNELTLSFIGT